MEFPKLGQNCSESSCKKLDFLPIKCDGCGSTYCNDHYKYIAHDCPAAYKNNVQVPECPLCGVPVPIPRGQQPDVAVGAHIDRDCKWDPSKERKVFTNKCSKRGCKTKEIIPVLCSECENNFCLRHRHTADHDCAGPRQAARSKAANAAIQRRKNDSVNRNLSSIQNGNMSEDEALARAVELSLRELQTDLPEAGLDEDMRRALEESRRQAGMVTERASAKDKCLLS